MDGGLIIVLAFLLFSIIAIIALYITEALLAKYTKDLMQARSDLERLKLLNKMKVDWDGEPIRYEDFK